MAVPHPPIEPPPTPWRFPEGAEAVTAAARGSEVVGTGADLEPGTVLAAYRRGLFPMPVRRGVLAWWSPDSRGVLPLDGLRLSRSLRRSVTRYQVRVDTCFEAVIDACADRRRPGAWIDRRVRDAYVGLHRLGWAHSVECFEGADLVGGLYGLGIGGLFAGESMFHRATDASKVALVELVRRLGEGGATLLDVQWATEHLRSLGVVEVPRAGYHRMLEAALGVAAEVDWRSGGS